MSAYSAAILGTSGLISYWRCDESSGNLADLGSGGITLTAAGTPTYQQTTPISNDDGYAVYLAQGTADTFSNASPGSVYNGGSGLTVEGWLKTGAHSGATYYHNLVRALSSPFTLRVNNLSETDFVVQVTGDAFTVANVLPGTFNANDGNWHHIVGTWVASSGAMTVYIDGASRKTASRTGTLKTPTTIYVGSGNSAAENQSSSVDEVAIYNRALTAAEVLYHYNLGKGIIGNDQRSKPGRRHQAVTRAAVF